MRIVHGREFCRGDKDHKALAGAIAEIARHGALGCSVIKIPFTIEGRQLYIAVGTAEELRENVSYLIDFSDANTEMRDDLNICD